MEQLVWSVDDRKYQEKNEKSLILEGWAFQREGQPLRFLLTDPAGEQIPMEEPVRFARPDVEAGYPETAGTKQCGFTIRIPNAEALVKKHEKLRLVVTDGKEKAILWETDSQQLYDFCKDQMMEVHIDRQEVLYRTMIAAEGWVLCQKGTDRILLQDGKGNPVPLKLSRGRRPDVVESLALGTEYKEKELGFQISGKLADVAGGRLVLVFIGNTGREEIRKQVEIDLKKLQAENSPAGRRKKVLAWENRKENLECLRKKGIRGFLKYVDAKAGIVTGDYEQWLMRHKAGRKELMVQRKTHFPYEPKISIVIPLYNTPLPYLKEAVDSIVKQTYKNWQLCLADGSTGDELTSYIHKHYGRDPRICYKKLEKNGGISENTNAAVKMADGDYILLADHDDVVAPDALFHIVKAINESIQKGDRPADALYTDEDKISMDGAHYFEPNFKPDYNLFRLRENNYICHIFVVKKELLKQVGLFSSDYDGAQDYDLILRCCEKAENIVHIPRVLYHWRCHMESTAADPASKAYAYEAGKRALEAHYKRVGIQAEVEMTKRPGWYRSQVKIKGQPLISIIIPNKDHVKDLELCLSSIDKKSTYRNFEVLVVENNSNHPETFEYYEKMTQKYSFVRLLTWKEGFNFSAINNFAAAQANGEYFLFLNNDVEVLTPNWIQEMLMLCQQKDVGAAGAKLFYPDDTIQHAGVVIGLGGIAGHIFCRASGSADGYMGRLVSVQEYSAVTAACMLVKKEDFLLVDGFDPEFVVAFNDIDFCMKLGQHKKKVVFTPYAQLYHYESKSRGMEDTPEKQLRFKKETLLFEKKWEKELAKGDPYYSPNLSVTEGDCSLREV